MSPAAATRLGPYEIQAAIGAGGMGEVYKARDIRLGRTVAIKVLPEGAARDPERRRRFEQEARAASRLNHPHICVLHDISREGDTDFLVMEFLEGETLARRLRKGPLPLERALELGAQIADALARAHREGIVHRDLKPANVMLTKDGAKLLDFGLAKLRPDAVPVADGGAVPSTATIQTASGVVLGTVPYMAPEQLEGKECDGRTDLFAFGCVLYEMVTGRRAFAGESEASVISAIMTSEPPPLRAVQPLAPPLLDRLVSQCLAKAADERPDTAHDVASQLRWMREASVAESPDGVRGHRVPGLRASDGRTLVAIPDEGLHAVSGATPLRQLDERSPYPGLRSFTEQDAAVFFGREHEVTALWQRIQTRPLLAVIGPSGAGKTSFLRAGVLPARPDGWAAIVCTPGTAPLRALGQALVPELTTDLEALRQLLSFEDPEVAFSVLRRWRQAHSHALVVLDQFEELFTVNPPETQATVASLIGRLTTEAGIHVVLSLRDDFLMRCHGHTPLEAVFSELTPLGGLSRGSLRRALVQPALERGYRFEDEALVDEIVDGVEGARAALPLLAFAMSRVWELRDGERTLLTREAYQSIGGVGGALAQHAEAAVDRIGPAQQDLVRELFRNLVTAQGTRAVIDRDELLSAFSARPAADAVLRALVDARLLTSYEVEGKPGEPSGHFVEIAHESLLKAWPRLVRWQTQDEDGARLRDQLKQAARLWTEKGCSADLLWTGTAYREYAVWRERYPGALTAGEEEFARSMTGRALHRKRVRRAALAAGFAALAIVALAVGMSRQQAVAAAQRAEASKLLALAELRLAEDPTEALVLAGASLEQADLQEARTFVMKALWEAPPAFEVIVPDQSVRKPAFSPDGKWLAAAGHSSVARVWTEDGRGPIVLPGLDTSPRGGSMPRWASNDTLVIGGAESVGDRVHVWSLPTGKRLRTIEFGRPSEWQVGPGRLLVQTAGTEPDPPAGVLLRSWLLPTGESVTLGRVDLEKLGAASSVLEPNGRSLLYVKGCEVYTRPLPTGTGADRLFEQAGPGQRPSPTCVQPPELLHVAEGVVDYVSDLNRVGLVDGPGNWRLWDYGRGGEPALQVVGAPAPGAVFPDRSGRWMVGEPARDQEVRVWDPAAWAGARPLRLRRSVSWYGAAVALHPVGDWVVASTARFTHLTFWPLRRPPSRIVEGYSNLHRPVAFSPDGKWVATSWGDGRLRLWPVPASGTSQVRTFGEPVTTAWTDIAFDPAARFVFAVGGQGKAWVVPLDGSRPRRLEGFSREMFSRAAAVSPSGRQVAAAFFYGQGEKTLRVWDLESGTTKRFDLPAGVAAKAGGEDSRGSSGYERGLSSLAFSDESTLYSAGDGGLRRWDLDTGMQTLLAASSPSQQAGAQFSRDVRLVAMRDADPAAEKRRLVRVYDNEKGTSRDLPTAFGEARGIQCFALDPSGRLLATGGVDGIVRVGRLDDGEPHILAGHKGTVDRVAISPDLRWVASTGEDNTLRLWPMPDLSRPPLHSLPLDQLLAKLRSLTNLRAVRDPVSASGWRIEVGPFPGWKDVPTW